MTNFHRVDTFGALIDVDQEHIYVSASADPLGTNPTENCQVFSTDLLASYWRQLTNFRETEHSVRGCCYGRLGLGCTVYVGAQDPRSRDLLLDSTCDPLGANPNGMQIFAMRPDGSGLRQLTDARGSLREAPGVFTSDLPGPWAYGPYVP